MGIIPRLHPRLLSHCVKWCDKSWGVGREVLTALPRGWQHILINGCLHTLKVVVLKWNPPDKLVIQTGGRGGGSGGGGGGGSGECLHVYSCTTVHLKWVHVLLYTRSIVLLCVVHVLAWYRHMYEEDTLTRLWVSVEVFRDEGSREQPLSDRRLSPPPVLITAVRGGRRGQRSGGHSYIDCID